MSHTFTRQKFGDDATAEHAARCKCGDYSGRQPNRQMVEDWEYQHLQIVERVKAHLRSHTPSLKAQRNYYQEMADATDAPPNERQLWQQLADEISIRLNDGAPRYTEDRLL